MIRKLEDDIAGKKKKLEGLWIENARHAAEKDLRKGNLNKRGEEMTKKFKDLQNKLKGKEAEYRKARRNRENTQNNLDRVKRELETAMKQFDTLDREVRYLQLNLDEEDAAHEAVVNDVNKEIECNQAEIDKFKKKIRKAQ